MLFNWNNMRYSFELVLFWSQQCTLQACYEFKSQVNKMINNMDVIEKHHLRKIQKTNSYQVPLGKTFQMVLFRGTIKTTVFVFVSFDSCPCFVDGKLGKEIHVMSFIANLNDTHVTDL